MRARSSLPLVVCCIGILALDLAGPVGVSAQTTQNCGNEGEDPCWLQTGTGTGDFCDTGLGLELWICGCLVQNPFGGCLIPLPCLTCENNGRRRAEIDAFDSTWVAWALRSQRELAQDEPLNRVMHLGTHNSFNTIADGYPLITLPNQYFSMTDQLRSGARLLTLDLQFLDNNARLCHSPTWWAPGICTLDVDPSEYSVSMPGMRFYAQGVKEIKNWLDDNPNEIILINTEDFFIGANGERAEYLLAPLWEYFGDRMLESPLTTRTQRWPTRREMLASGRRVVLFAKSGERPPAFSEEAVVGPFSEAWYANNLRRYPNCPTTEGFTFDASTDTFKVEDDRILSDGDLVRFQTGVGSPFPTGVREGTSYFIVSLDRDSKTFQAAPVRGGRAVDLAADGSGELFVNPSRRASLTVEDREWLRAQVGILEAQDVADAAECNYSFIVLDKFSRDSLQTDFSRQAAAVWSWKENDRGDQGECAMLEAATGRWASFDCERPLPFACARPRTESGLRPLEWKDPLGLQWRITTASGPWDEGHALCESEFPGFVAGVPVNGYQNRVLRDANIAGTDLWLNYTRRDTRGGRWIIRGRPVAN